MVKRSRRVTSSFLLIVKLFPVITTSVVIGTTLLASCGVSEAETRKQLDAHIKAYQNIDISTGNASSIIKSTNILLNPNTKSNSFYSELTDSSKGLLVAVKEKAESIIAASDEELLTIPGVGVSFVKKLRKSLGRL